MPNLAESLGSERAMQLVASIYAAGLSPDGWHDALTQMRQAFGLPYAAHMTRSDDHAKRFGIASGASQQDYDSMLEKFFTRSVYFQRPYPFFAGQVAASRDMAPMREILDSAIYQEWNKERDVHEMLRLVVRSEGGVSQVVTLARPWSAGPFRPAEVTLCRTLMPHLQAASLAAERLRGADLFAAAALSGLDLLGHAVLLLAPDARLFHANRVGEELLAQPGAIRAVRGTLQGATAAQTARLDAAVARALGLGGGRRASYVRLAKPAGGMPLTVLVVPMEQEASWAVLHRPAVMVCVTDPDRDAALPGRHLIELFGLTRAEATLAEDLLAGHELRDIAQRQGRSIHTVRTHLARLMAKTDVNRQSRLVRLLATIPRAD